jgi:hypothetical protein
MMLVLLKKYLYTPPKGVITNAMYSVIYYTPISCIFAYVMTFCITDMLVTLTEK